MIEITATAESMAQAMALIDIGIDTLLIGESRFALRLPASFSREEQQTIVNLAHENGKKVTVAVNGIMHPEKMLEITDYLHFLEEIKVDQLLVGDPGVIYKLQKEAIKVPYLYDAHTMVTSSKQINFWGKKGAIGAVIAREVPYLELVEMAKDLEIYGEILVYGATCIHQSKRPLLQNYFSYVQSEEEVKRQRGLFLSEPEKAESHYGIFEDEHGTHIFADNDVNLMLELEKLVNLGFNHWKLDGIFTPGNQFVEIAKRFIAAKSAFQQQEWNELLKETLNKQVVDLHPENRGLDTGFFLMNPSDVK